MKRFVIACIVSGITWIITGVFLIFLQNSDFFSIAVGLITGIGIGLSTYFGSLKFDTQYFFINVIFIVLFLFALFSLVKITSGRVALTSMTIVLSFLIFQKGIYDWRQRCR